MSFFDYLKYDSDSFDSARDYFLGVLEDVYETGNINHLERHLDELCAYFEVKMPNGEPMVAKKRSEAEIRTERTLQSWVGETRAYAEFFCNS